MNDDFEATVERWLRQGATDDPVAISQLRQSAATIATRRPSRVIPFVAASTALGVAVVVGLVAGAILRTPLVAGPSPVPSVAATVSTQMSETVVRDLVVVKLEGFQELVPDTEVPIEIVSAEAMTLGDAYSSLGEPIISEGSDLDQVVWLVRANGPFITARGGPGNPGLLTGTSGYFIIDDATGSFQGMGFSR